jgi:hypothetical protein
MFESVGDIIEKKYPRKEDKNKKKDRKDKLVRIDRKKSSSSPS